MTGERDTLSENGREFRTLAHRSDMTGADRTWAAQYRPSDLLSYASGSKMEGIERGSYSTVRFVDTRANMLTVDLDNGTSATYDPRRLRGVNLYIGTTREFANGGSVQFTASSEKLGIANRDLGTVTSLADGRIAVQAFLHSKVRWLVFKLSFGKTPKSLGKMHLHDDLVAELRQWQLECTDPSRDAFIFPNADGGFMDTSNYRSRVLKPLADALGIPKLNFQVIRRTIATRAQSLGSVRDIQSHPRHSRADTTANEYMQELPESVQLMVGTVYAMLTANAGSERVH